MKRRGARRRFPEVLPLSELLDHLVWFLTVQAEEIGGQLVGNLSRTEAPRWQPLVQQLAARGYAASCEAMIAGRGRDGETDNLGVFLHLPTPTEARASIVRLTGPWPTL